MLIFTILLGHILLLLGIRVFFGLLSSDSIKIKTFMRSWRFKWIVIAYLVVVTAAIVLPLLFLRN